MRALISLASICLAGCAGTQPITIDEPPPPVVCSQQPWPDFVDLQDTPPRVVFDAETTTWGYWFSPAEYAAIAENLQTLRRYGSQLRAVGLYYRSCIADHNAQLAAGNPGD